MVIENLAPASGVVYQLQECHGTAHAVERILYCQGFASNFDPDKDKDKDKVRALSTLAPLDVFDGRLCTALSRSVKWCSPPECWRRSILHTPDWGTLAPEDLPSTRRLQTLGLGAAVRHFNDRAVPGLGGMWFPMPLVWSVLAVALAEKMNRSALPVGNAIEAAVMLSVLKQQSVMQTDGRVRGRRKLAEVEDGSLENLSRRGAYVVQPIRMAMVQPLSALGFVRGNRYGSFRLHDAGQRMLILLEIKERRWLKKVSEWADGRGDTTVFNSLSPLERVPEDICKLIRARIIEGDGAGDSDAARRRNMVAFMEQNGDLSPNALDQQNGPARISAAHWRDLRAGCALMDLRDDALSVLRAIEAELLQRRRNNEPARIALQDAPSISAKEIGVLEGSIGERLDRIAAAGENTSTTFARHCREPSKEELIRFLADRDGSVIRLSDGYLEPGPAAGDLRDTEGEEQGEPPSDERKRFAPQLYRLWNLHCLMEELNAQPNPNIEQQRVA